MLQEHMELADCNLPLEKLGDGNYLFGTKKIFAKILNGQLVVRVGGGYMVVDEFIRTYAEAEQERMKQNRGSERNSK